MYSDKMTRKAPRASFLDDDSPYGGKMRMDKKSGPTRRYSPYSTNGNLHPLHLH